MQPYSIRARLSLIGLALGAALAALLLVGYGLASAAPGVGGAGVVLAPPGSAQSAPIGATVTYTLQITNTGATTDTFDLSITGFHWPTNLLGVGTGGTILLPHNGHGTFQVEVMISPTSSGHDVTTVHAISTNNSAISTTALITTTVLIKLYLPVVRK